VADVEHFLRRPPPLSCDESFLIPSLAISAFLAFWYFFARLRQKRKVMSVLITAFLGY
jgi:hypothetical protein